jgi:hypothetical protein
VAVAVRRGLGPCEAIIKISSAGTAASHHCIKSKNRRG